ncbi:hypothetical protein Tco_0705379 [Tanacetum coccineum]|uniref:Uncharacterized protein n=1 Tax=Tanacetum coccineum TaxID=301880 RepID=A0ABQ4Y4F2_9ASTR
MLLISRYDALSAENDALPEQGQYYSRRTRLYPAETRLPKKADFKKSFLANSKDEIFLEKNLISKEVSRRAVELEETQDEDTSPSKNTSKIPMEVEGFEPPQEEVVPVHSLQGHIELLIAYV